MKTTKRVKQGKKVATAKAVKKSRQAAAGQNKTRPIFIVCIGASAGGLQAVTELVTQLPAGISAAIFVVLHLSKTSVGDALADRIRRITPHPVNIAADGEAIRAGRIYVAPADAHLMVKDDKVLLGYGPAENRFRPSIDILFRSAAAHYGERVIGIVLTGLLNDGTAGMWAIKQAAGYCIVQDTNEAEYPDMPLSVLETMEVDQSLPLKKMGEAILNVVNNKEILGLIPPRELIAESKLAERAAIEVDEVASLGEQTKFSCPDCGGPLWLMDKPFPQYRCHIGHSYLEKELLSRQTESIESTLWVSLRMMEEKRIHLLKVAVEYDKKGYERLAIQYKEKAQHLDMHIKRLKDLLFQVNHD